MGSDPFARVDRAGEPLPVHKREDKADSQQESFIELKQTSVKEVPVIVKIGVVSIELYSGFQVETLHEAIAAIRSI